MVSSKARRQCVPGGLAEKASLNSLHGLRPCAFKTARPISVVRYRCRRLLCLCRVRSGRAVLTSFITQFIRCDLIRLVTLTRLF